LINQEQRDFGTNINSSNFSVLMAIKDNACTCAKKNALIEGLSGHSVSYGEFWRNIIDFATIIHSQGLIKNECVIILVNQSIAYMEMFYGIQLAGGIAVPIEPGTSNDVLKKYASFFSSRFIVVKGIIYDSHFANMLVEHKCHAQLIFSFNDEEATKQNIEYYNKFFMPTPNDPALILMTSGTNGENKAVVGSHKGRYCGADNVSDAYGLNVDDTALIPQPLSHSGGLRRVEAMFICGGTAVIMKPTMFFGDVFAALKNYNCNVLQLVPAQAEQILRSAKKLLSASRDQLKIVAVGSAEITEVCKEALRELLPGVRLFNDYGSTEAIGSAYFEWSAYPPKPYCVGREGRHSNITFLNECGLPYSASSDKPGIIATEGDTLMLGYYGETEINASSLVDGRVVSTDLGYRGDDGMIYIVGRKSDIIISGANKITPVEIEEVVGRINGVKECAVIAKPDHIMGHLPALFVVFDKHVPITINDIICEMCNKLEHYKVPKAENIFSISSLPRTPGTGKVIKRHLLEEV